MESWLLRRHTNHFLSQKVLLYLLTHCLVPASSDPGVDPRCRLPTPGVSGLSRDGDIILGGIFVVHDDIELQETTFTSTPAPITCQRFGLQNYQFMQAMVFAIDEINSNPHFLPNITLGFWIYDSCAMMRRALEGVLWILTGQGELVPNFRCQSSLPLLGIMGDAGSSCSIVMARVLGLYRFPQISYFSSSPALSDRNQFPSFFRTIPSDDFQSHGLAQLLVHFGWTWVGLLIEDNDYGQQGVQKLRQELAKTEVCIAFSENIVLNQADRNALHIIQVIKSSTADAVVIFCSDAGLIPLIDEMVAHNVTGKTWIASEAWSTSAPLSMAKYRKFLAGTIGFAIRSGALPGFEQHLTSIHPSRSSTNGFIGRFWEEVFGCKWLDHKLHSYSLDNRSILCTGEENLEGLHNDYTLVSNSRVAYNVYNAVYATAWALQNLKFCNNSESALMDNCGDNTDFQPWQLLHYVKNVRFQSKVGAEIFFNNNGEVGAQYDIVNWQLDPDGNLRQVTVGIYDYGAPGGQTLKINTSAILWSSGISQGEEVPPSVCSQSCLPGFRKAVREGQPVCCFLCVPCPQGEISNQTDATECSKCPWDQWPNSEQDNCVLKVIEFLSYEEPLGVGLTAICIFFSLMPVTILELFIHHRNAPIVKANNRSLSYLLLFSLALCFLCSLIFIGYPTTVKCLLRQAAFGITFALCISCILAKTIMVVIAFNATRPNSDLRRWVGPQLSYIVIGVCTIIQVLLCASWLILSPPSSEYNINSQPGKILYECNEGSTIAFWCMLGYLGLLATTSFVVAFLARKLPDSFNEAKFITFSMLAFLTVWLSFIPAYLSTKGKYMVAMEVFAILSSSSALVSCIFLPKCYIILLRPEMNTKEYLMGKDVGKK
ncbi:extracellular calcium-sensing receptor-like [Lissotriton helveticus]